MTINEQDVMAAKDGMIFDLTNQVLQLKAELASVRREARISDEELDEALASTNGNLNAVPSSEN